MKNLVEISRFVSYNIIFILKKIFVSLRTQCQDTPLCASRPNSRYCLLCHKIYIIAIDENGISRSFSDLRAV